jgi:hypothetical protein
MYSENFGNGKQLKFQKEKANSEIELAFFLLVKICKKLSVLFCCRIFDSRFFGR